MSPTISMARASIHNACVCIYTCIYIKSASVMLHSGGQEFAQSCKEWALALRGKSWPGMRCCTLPAQGFPLFFTLPRESGSIMFRITVRGKSWRSLEGLALALQGKGWPGMCCSAKPRTAVACVRAGTQRLPFFRLHATSRLPTCGSAQCTSIVVAACKRPHGTL